MSEVQEDSVDLAAIQQQMVRGDLEGARAALETVLAESPDHADALYMYAVCQRYAKDLAGALKTLERLKLIAPDNGRAHQEEGHTLRAAGRFDDALAAFARATRANPALEASWRAQVELFSGLGAAPQAAQAKAQLEFIQGLPKPLVGVIDLISQGKLVKAEDLCRGFLKQVPHHIEGMRLLADIGSRLGVLDDADFLLESAAEFAPDNVRVRMDYIQVLRKRQQFEKALDEARKLLDMQPDNPQFQSIYAIEAMQSGDYETALEMFDRVLERVPSDPSTLVSRGHALKTIGKSDQAIDAYHSAIVSTPQYGESYYSLANLKTYTFTEDEIERMHAQEQSGNLSHMDRVYLCFALGKAYEDRHDFETAFKYYERGNSLKKAQSRYRAEQMSEEFAQQREVCTLELFADKAGMGCDAPDPIFVVGLPRAGSTLLEQILSSHSQVDGTLELPNILALSHKLRRGERMSGDSKYPAVLADLGADELRQFGEQFIEETRIHRQGAPLFIDKMPNNFRHIGLIKLILPNAKVIDARRHPLSCCFSGFKQLFAEGQEFSYDLHDIGRYYRDYVDLMDHWDEVLPGFVLRVQHEDVVADLEAEVRRMLDFCGLDFEEACLNYYETERNVRTPSSEQVRQPIFTDSLEQWRNFEPWLEPLFDALGTEVLERYPVERHSGG